MSRISSATSTAATGPRGFGRQLLALALSPFVRQRFVILAAKEHHSHLEKLAAFVDLHRS